MEEINDKVHTVLMYNSWNKAIFNYKYNGVLDFRDLKMLDIIYKILNETCYMLDSKETYRLKKEYFRIIRENPLICSIYTDVQLFTGNSYFAQSYQPKGSAVPTTFKYFQDNQLRTITVLENAIAQNNFPETSTTIGVENVIIGYKFKMNSFGRLAIYLDSEKYTNFKITDILNLDITSHFKIKKVNKGYSIISNEIHSSGDIYLKFKID